MTQIRLLAFLISLLAFTPLLAVEEVPRNLKEVGVTPRIGEQVALDASFLNSRGERVFIGDYLNDERSVIFNFVYLNCPMLCGLLLDGIKETITDLHPRFDGRYRIVSVSMDNRDTVARAAQYRERYLGAFPDRDVEWEFLVGDEENIARFADSLGFRFKFLPENGEFAHGAAVMFASKNGMISRYLYGVMFRPFDFKMAILESENKKSISPIEQGLLFCYNYDPNAEGYVIEAIRLMQIACFLSVGLLIIVLVVLTLQGRQNGRKSS